MGISAGLQVRCNASREQFVAGRGNNALNALGSSCISNKLFIYWSFLPGDWWGGISRMWRLGMIHPAGKSGRRTNNKPRLPGRGDRASSTSINFISLIVKQLVRKANSNTAIAEPYLWGHVLTSKMTKRKRYTAWTLTAGSWPGDIIWE